ncbi:hypothetical protein Poli38472_007084 [Pythium oligandrum]|uniref:Uncharacterized protein n=1 Tax=Pythium oligandrum TaxID=41045 RepID=A0A8K1C9H5_PYTOL|nr:hypothetical protein Poli38472_007084 [Pythium oligandrum]|eukprot:TMW58939.1 hypothetical protein Poli38472_007084 [Pythium oligandrum]
MSTPAREVDVHAAEAEANGPYTALATPTSRVKVDTISTIEEDALSDTKSKDKKKKNLVSLAELFSFADKTDLVLMTVGTIGALGAGTLRPLIMLLMGDAVNAFNPSATDISPSEFRSNVNTVSRNFAIVGVAGMFGTFLQSACWAMTAARQSRRIRSAYVRAILQKEIGWFDVNDPMQLSSRVSEAIVTLEAGIGAKLAEVLHFSSTMVAGITIGLVRGWELALITLAFAPVLAITMGVMMKVTTRATQESINAYGKAGAVAQEALSNIKTVHMFNAMESFVAKYDEALQGSIAAGIRKGITAGASRGVLWFCMFCMFACGMFFGALFVVNDRRDGCVGDKCYNGGHVLTVFMSVLMGAMAIGQVAPGVEAFTSARTAAYDMIQIINRPSPIDPFSLDGKKLGKVIGQIDLENIRFAYPSRPDSIVCNDYSLRIAPGETIALVGPSGSGKSTIVSLLERFYDPLDGSVKLDGVDVRELNVAWLRQQVGLVGQEPVLFATNIMENIRSGRPGATDDEVLEAAKMANAFNFIHEFPQGFQTDVGERGAQLSGGQKQRIAIARAILKNPPVLLLDEATSALDVESERIVQESLDRLVASTKRTTIIVAHRLSTIRHADKIAVHSEGRIVELGRHEELMALEGGHYRRLVESQHRAKSEETTEDVGQAIVSSDRSSTHKMQRELSRASSSAMLEKVDFDADEQIEDDGTDVSMSRVWKLSVPELKFVIFGAIGTFLNAAVFPAWGVFYVKMITLFFEDKPRSDVLETARYWALAFVCLGILAIGSTLLLQYSFAVVSQRLIARVRLMSFKAMVNQDIGWFDLDENASGSLVSRLATDAAILHGMTSDALHSRLMIITTLLIAFGIAFYYSWQMTLLLFAIAPILIVTGKIRAKMMNGTLGAKKVNDADNAAGALFGEAVSAIRTVASFNMEKTLHNTYEQYIDTSRAMDTKSGVLTGVGIGVSQGMMFFSMAFLFYMGGKWVSNHTIDFEAMFTVLMVINLSTMSLGMATDGVTDAGKAKQAATRLFSVIDRTPAIDASSQSGEVLPHINGDIEFKRVQFAYPSRPDATIYSNYNLKIRAGQTVALVGASGSGKSTAIALLERFYDPAAGIVRLDGTDLRSLQLPWLRERISLVSQEPVLFAGTIGENIAMGKPGATREEVIDAAKKANAYPFISNFPQGFDTDVGDRGAQISGGQKQRIAIARAILRDPDVLLLDEATSALDNESERIVQESLDQLLKLKKRTTIIVAHRLSTIRHADLIAVTKDGEIVEQGTHEQLLSLPDGVYKSLVAKQMGDH